MSTIPSPPTVAEVPVMTHLHGAVIEDEYGWMLDVASDSMRSHLTAERAHADAQLRVLSPLAEVIAREMSSRHVDGHPAPATRNGRWWYFTRRPEGQSHLQYWRSRTDPAIVEEHAQLLIDGNVIARELGGFALGPFRTSPNDRYLAFGVDAVGNERFTIMFRDLDVGGMLDDRLLNTHYTCAWLANSAAVIYTTADHVNRPHRVWRHRLGTKQAEDELLFEDNDPGVWLTVGSTRSGEIVFIRGASHTSTEFHLLDANDPRGRPELVRARAAGVYYEIDHQRGSHGGTLYVLHNTNGPNFELATATRRDPSNWLTILPHSDVQRLHWVTIFDSAIVLYARESGRTGLLRVDADGTVVGRHFSEPGATISPASNPDYSANSFRYSYTSPTTPTSIRSLDLRDGTTSTIDTMTVGPALDGTAYQPSDYVAEELWATSHDGTEVPITVVHRRDMPPDGQHGCVLYAYGAYERTADMGFSVNRLSLLDRGIGYAVAHVRGGGELGKRWHEAGRRGEKRKSIDDYLACARLLLERRYAAPGGIVGRSSSAGAIVIGAAMNSAPEIFAGVVLTAPFVDPLTSLLDPQRPLTVAEWEELGNPLDDAEAFASIRSYSPYENIREVRYPPVLALAGDEDARVSIAEPARWIARLRSRASGGPFVLLPEFGSGHRGLVGRRERLTKDALVTAWIVRCAAQVGSRSTSA